MKPLLMNQKCVVSVMLTVVILFSLQVASYGAPVSERTPEVRDAIVAAIEGVDSAAEVTEEHLATITTLNLSNQSITSLKSGDFDGLTGLTSLDMSNNSISDISSLSGLTGLTTLNLSNNSISDLSPLSGMIDMEFLYLSGNSFSEAEFRALMAAIGDNLIYSDVQVTRTDIPVDITDVDEGNAPVFTEGSSTSRSVAENTPPGENIGAPIVATDVNRNDTLSYTLGGTDAAAFSIIIASGQLQTKDALDYETKSSYAVTIFVNDGTGGTSSIDVTINVTNVAENTDVPEAPTLLDGRTQQVRDAIVAALGKPAAEVTSEDLATIGGLSLKNKGITSLQSGDFDGLTSLIALDLSNNSISDISPLSGLTGLTNLNLSNNSISDLSPLSRLRNLQYLYLSGNLFSEEVFRALMAAIGDGLSYIDVQIPQIPDNESSAPVFTEGPSTSRSVAAKAPPGTNIGAPIGATDADSNDTLTYTLGGTDAASFDIISTSGQLRTKAPLDYETKSSYSVTVSVSDGTGGTDSITVTINITDVRENSLPVFTEGSSTSRSVAENTFPRTNIGAPVAATDTDSNDTLTYTLGGEDAASFSIVRASGQLRTSSALDYETKPSYSVTVFVSDSAGGTDSITVTINITDVYEINAPVFTEGSSTSRSVAENTPPGTNIGAPVVATDINSNDTLTYTVGGTDAASFSIILASGQLRTNAALDYETKSSYAVTVFVNDGNSGTDSIAVTINVTDVAENTDVVEALALLDGRTQQVRDAIVAAVGKPAAEVTLADLATIRGLSLKNKGITSLQSGDFDGLTGLTNLDLSNNSISDISALSGLTGLTNLNLSNNSISDLSPLSRLRNLQYLYLSGNSFSEEAFRALMAVIGDSLWYVDVQVPQIPDNESSAPVFTEGPSTSRSVAANTPPGTNIGAPIGATDVNSNDTLTYTLGGTDAASFDIISTSGQLRTKAPLDYETKSSYSVTVSVSDGTGGTDSITVTINITDVRENSLPVFTEGSSTSRSVAENTVPRANIGAPVAATDADSNDTLTYTVGGEDAASFSIISTSGQLRTSSALDYETKPSYSVTVFVSDSAGGTDSITVTINITDVYEINAPVFTEGTSTSRSVAENTPPGENIGAPVAATDVNSNDTLTYTVGGTDAASFSIILASGQLRTNAALDYETKSSYAVTVFVNDGRGGTDSIAVTINVTDVAENTDVVTGVAEGPTPLDGRTQQVADAIVAALGKPAAEVTLADLATITSLSLSNQGITSLTSGDFDGLTGLRSLDLSNNSISDISALSGLTGLRSLNLSNNSISDLSPLSGMIDMEFLYLSGNSFSEEAFRALMAAIGDNLIYSDVQIPQIPDNENSAPVFTEGPSTSRSVAENTPSGENIGAPVAATDVNSNDTLSYTLGGTDAAAFSIIIGSGQLQTNAALDYETKSSYSVTVFVNDGLGGTDSIDVTINITDVDESITDVNESPVFTDGESTSRSVAEDTPSGENIGSPVAATDADSNDTLTYTLGGTDAAAFAIVSSSGQLQTNAALDYETKASYAVTVSVSDGNGGTDSIDVTINVTEVTEEPTLLDGRTQQVADAIVAAVGKLAADVTSEDLATITSLSLSSQGITSLSSGDFDGLTGLRSLNLSNNSISDISPLSGLTGLRSLDLSNNSISDISPLSGMIDMEFLYLSGNSFSEEAFRALMAAIGDNLIYIDVQIPQADAPAIEPPATSALFANYPNPSNPETWIPYRLAKPADVTISIYNVKGELVRTLALGHQRAGVYRTRSRAAYWDGKNALGEPVASGIYFYQLTTPTFQQTRLLVILK